MTLLLLSICLSLIFGLPAMAQETNFQGIAEHVPMSEEDIPNGSIVSLTNDGYHLTTEPYDSNLFGVVTHQPAVAVSSIGKQGSQPVNTNGVAQVRVTAQNGAIATGDPITSSEQKGIGMRATKAGFVLGKALSTFDPNQADEISVIPVSIKVEFATIYSADQSGPRAFADQLRQALTIGARAAAAEPNTALRYIVAGLVLIISIAFAFLVFGRNATNGVISIGRNPLARRSVIAVVIFNIAITVGFALSGLALSIFILAI